MSTLKKTSFFVKFHLEGFCLLTTWFLIEGVFFISIQSTCVSHGLRESLLISVFLGTRPAVSFHTDAVVPKVFTDVLVESLPNHD